MTRSSPDAWLDLEVDRVWLLVARLARADAARSRVPLGGELERLLERHGAQGQDALEHATAAVAIARANAPIGRLATRLELGTLELDALAIAIAPHVDPDL